jgi:UrcA family protein
MKIHIALSVAALSGIFALNVAHAENENSEPTAQTLAVQFDDLDLNTHKDAVTMYDRLHLAAMRVCSTERGVSLREHLQYSACVDRAVGASVARLDRPVLSRYAAEQSGRVAEERVAKRR